MTLAASHIGYFALLAALLAVLPGGFMGDLEGLTQTLLVVGALGAWRYSWAGLNFLRAIYYRRVAYPARSRQWQRDFAASGVPSHMYVMITSYKVPAETTIMVYRALFAAAARAPHGSTIVASVVDGADERLIRTVFETARVDLSGVRLVIDRIRSNGKRDAMEKALRRLARMAPTEHDILVFIDGDTAVPEDIWAQAAPVFSDPRIGALTTDEKAVIDRPGLFRDWFTLRFDQRQVMMCSVALSHRVLTLTGRMSVFRATLATDPGFIEAVGRDHLDHWRLGRIAFLTGDDKSTWFWLLGRGWHMAYLPDVVAHSVETQPRPTFFAASQVLMVRWFGNMMRTNGRALALSPRLIGGFTWWSILDQRVSMFTTLVGPISVLATALLANGWVLPLYAAWIMATRYIYCTCLAAFRGRPFAAVTPLLLYYSQVFGAITKSFVFFRLDRQKWTRQPGGSAEPAGGGNRDRALESAGWHAMAVGWLTLAILFLHTVE